jgi:hypothetical protein
LIPKFISTVHGKLADNLTVIVTDDSAARDKMPPIAKWSERNKLLTVTNINKSKGIFCAAEIKKRIIMVF